MTGTAFTHGVSFFGNLAVEFRSSGPIDAAHLLAACPTGNVAEFGEFLSAVPRKCWRLVSYHGEGSSVTIEVDPSTVFAGWPVQHDAPVAPRGR